MNGTASLNRKNGQKSATKRGTSLKLAECHDQTHSRVVWKFQDFLFFDPKPWVYPLEFFWRKNKKVSYRHQNLHTSRSCQLDLPFQFLGLYVVPFPPILSDLALALTYTSKAFFLTEGINLKSKDFWGGRLTVGVTIFMYISFVYWTCLHFIFGQAG